MNLSMKANDHKREDIHIAHDAGLGFAVWLGQGQIHIRAKDPHEPDAARTTIVIDANVEVVK